MNDRTYCDNPLLWEEIYSSKPSQEGLYFHELMMLKYVGYGSYYSNESRFPAMWLYQMMVLYPDALIYSLIERGYVVEDTLYNTLSSRKDIVLNLVQEKGFSPKNKNSDNVRLVYDNYTEEELCKLVPFRKYILTSNGSAAIEEYSNCDAFTPYCKRNPMRYIYGTSEKRYIEPHIDFYHVDIFYDSICDEFYFTHATKQKEKIQNLNLDFLYLVIPKDISGTFAEVYEKAAIKANPTTFRFFYDNLLVYQNINIESIFALNKNSTKIVFSKLWHTETTMSHIKNPEGVPDRTIIQDVNYYDYFSYDFKEKLPVFIETLTEKLDLKNIGNRSLKLFSTNFVDTVIQKFLVKGTRNISFSVSNYLGELIVKHYLGNKYTLVAIEADWCSNDSMNYKISIPENDVLGLTYLWYLRDRKLINDPICFEDSVASVLEKTAHVLYKNDKEDIECDKVTTEVLREYKRTLDIKLTKHEKSLLEKCGNNPVLAAEMIVSCFGERWLAGDYINFEKGLINAADYEKRLSDCRQMYNEALVLLQQEGFYIPKWKQEFQLFLLLSSYYPDAFFQYRADWLELQSLDVFLPSLNIAFEYQGEQHHRPIEFFGGEEHYRKTVERDLKKRAFAPKTT